MYVYITHVSKYRANNSSKIQQHIIRLPSKENREN